MGLSLFQIIILTCFCISFAEVCINSKYNFEKYLGSKTPYRVVANNTFGKIQYSGCQPTKIWMVIRHGTRNPSIELIQKINDRLPEIRDLILEKNPNSTEHLSNYDLDLFRKWSSKLKNKDEKKLTTEGEDEMTNLAERMQSRFPDVLPGVYSNTSYQLKFTATQRTRKSAKYFAVGLFGRSTAKDVWFPEPLQRDPVLRFYKLCKKWRNDVSKNPASLQERRNFENSSVMLQTIKDVYRRLGLKQNQLSLNDVHNMYMTCAFETGLNKRRKSPWCSVFSIDNLKAMEYAEDLKYYWVDGYGYELTYSQACPAFNNMISMFNSKNTYPKATVYFTHSGTLLKMLAHMGLYKDKTPLTANDYKILEDRKWRSSSIDSFGTNLAFILHKCGNTQKILTLHQEQIVQLPACPGQDLCDIKEMEDYYAKSIKSCAFDSMCEN